MTAVENDRRHTGYVPEGLTDEEICLAMVRTSPGTDRPLRRLPGRSLNGEIRLAAVAEKYRDNIVYVPERRLNEEICPAAAGSSRNAYKYIPGRSGR